MTDEEIEKALFKNYDKTICEWLDCYGVLSYIRRLKAENERIDKLLTEKRLDELKCTKAIIDKTRKKTAKEILKRVDEIESENHLDPKDSYDCNAIDAYNTVRKFIKHEYGAEVEE